MTTTKKKAIRLCPKLTDEHMFPSSFQKMKVKYASQIFSHSLSAALNTYIYFKTLPPEAMHTAKFIQTINDLFDLLNSSHLNNFNAFMGTEKQLQFLEEIKHLLDDLKVIKLVEVKQNDGNVTYVEKCVNNTMHFINGWKITINSVQSLWETLKSKNYSFLLTRNLNQDCLENFFGLIRNCCGNSRNPTPIQFCRAFKKLFTQKYFNEVEGANCIQDINKVLLTVTPDVLQEYKNIDVPTLTNNSALKVYTCDYRNLSSTDGNALVYITGYLLKKCLLQHSCDTCTKYNDEKTLQKEAAVFLEFKAYSTSKNYGGLNLPPINIVEYVKQLETIFVENFNKISCYENVGAKLKELYDNIPFTHPCKEFPHKYFLSLYVRMRIYFTLKFANRDIKNRYSLKQSIQPNIKLNILKNL